MSFDVTNPVVALCVAGVQVEGTPIEARAVAQRALDGVEALPAGGYADMVRGGIDRLRERLGQSSSDMNVSQCL